MDSTTAPEASKKYSPRDRLYQLADKARATQGLLTPTEILELVDIAEYYREQFLDAYDETVSLAWDLSHPASKDR